MKARPPIGETGAQAIPTEMKHAVEFAGNGMPSVVSTPHIVGFLERTARETIGQTIHCTARVIAVDGTKISFQIEARDAHEVVVRGLHKRAVIRTDSFSRRVKAKSEIPAN